MPELTISEIYIYPIKSLGGIRLKNAAVQGKGLQFDRRWMLVDQNGVFLTQRVYPQMALFKLEMQDNQISITYRNGEQAQSSASFHTATYDSGNLITAKIWDDEVNVIEVDTAISQWFSQHLGMTCRLVNFPEEKPRPLDPRYKTNNEHVSLADAYPFLVIGQSSLDDLNARLAEPVPMNRFRPNFVFTGGDAYVEDQWRNLRIGHIDFTAVKKSIRCALITVDQDTAVRSAEPLRTLSTYRKADNKVFFGQNLVALGQGKVAVGDPVIPV